MTHMSKQQEDKRDARVKKTLALEEAKQAVFSAAREAVARGDEYSLQQLSDALKAHDALQ